MNEIFFGKTGSEIENLADDFHVVVKVFGQKFENTPTFILIPF